MVDVAFMELFSGWFLTPKVKLLPRNVFILNMNYILVYFHISYRSDTWVHLWAKRFGLWVSLGFSYYLNLSHILPVAMGAPFSQKTLQQKFL